MPRILFFASGVALRTAVGAITIALSSRFWPLMALVVTFLHYVSLLPLHKPQ